mgnify:CR=1 FL=1
MPYIYEACNPNKLVCLFVTLLSNKYFIDLLAIVAVLFIFKLLISVDYTIYHQT